MALAWFPSLLYTTVWIGNIYVQNGHFDMTDAQNHGEIEAGTRAGNRALLYSALVTLVVIAVMPFFVIAPKSPGSMLSSMKRTKEPWWKWRIVNLWTVGNGVLACCMGSTL